MFYRKNGIAIKRLFSYYNILNFPSELIYHIKRVCTKRHLWIQHKFEKNAFIHACQQKMCKIPSRRKKARIRTCKQYFFHFSSTWTINHKQRGLSARRGTICHFNERNIFNEHKCSHFYVQRKFFEASRYVKCT